MDYGTFIKEVMRRADIDSSEIAHRAVEATIETLGERLYRTDCDHLQAMLTAELKDMMSRRNEYHTFTLESFYTRVASRAGVGYPSAVTYSRAVVEVLKEATSPEQMEKIRVNLPAEYHELFGKEPDSPLSPTAESSR